MPALGKGLLGSTPKALRPLSNKQIVRQAKRLSRAVYRPALRSLRGEQKQAENLYQKRKSDNAFYRDWLNTRANELASNAAAADEALLNAGQQIQGSSAQSMQALQAALVQAAPGQVGQRVTEANATLTPQLQQRQDLVEAARSRNLSQVAGQQQQFAGRRSELLAGQTAVEAQTQADLENALRTIRASKQQVKLERSARAQEEVARLLEQEVAKAQLVVQMRGAAGELAIASKQHKAQVRQSARDRKLGRAQHREERRSNQANEANERAAINQRERDSQRDARGGEGGGKQHRRDEKNAFSAAQTLGRSKGRQYAKKHFAAFVKEIMEQSDVDHALAAKMARKWLRRSKNNKPSGTPPASTS